MNYTKTLEAIETIRKLVPGGQIKLPQIAVIGDQSAGKSALMSELTKVYCFPSRSGLGTKSPVVVTTQYRETPLYTVNGIVVSESNLEDQVASQFPASISQDPIYVVAEGPNRRNLTLVDLPGIIHHNENGGTDKETILQVIDEYIQNEKTLIITVTKADNDDANSLALSLARKVDPEGERTLRVLSMFDNIGSEARLQEAVSLIQNSVNDERGPHAVICRFSGRPYEATEELQKLSSMGLPAERAGIPSATDRVEKLLCHLVMTNVDHVRDQILLKIAEVRSVLDRVGYHPQNQSQIIHRFENALKAALKPLEHDLTSLFTEFHQNLKETKRFYYHRDENVPDWVANTYKTNYFQSPFFQGEPAFGECIRQVVMQEWKPLVNLLHFQVLEALENTLEPVVADSPRESLKDSTRVKDPPPISEKALALANKKLQEYFKSLEKQLDDAFNRELEKAQKPNSGNPELIQKFSEDLSIPSYLIEANQFRLQEIDFVDVVTKTRRHNEAIKQNLRNTLTELVKEHRENLQKMDWHGYQRYRLASALRAHWELSHQNLADNILATLQTMVLRQTSDWTEDLVLSSKLRELATEAEDVVATREESVILLANLDLSLQVLNKLKA